MRISSTWESLDTDKSQIPLDVNTVAPSARRTTRWSERRLPLPKQIEHMRSACVSGVLPRLGNLCTFLIAGYDDQLLRRAIRVRFTDRLAFPLMRASSEIKPITSYSLGESPMSRIDVHQHLVPPNYRRMLDGRGMAWPVPDWSPSSAIAMMDGRSIATGVLSLSAPGVHFGNDAESRKLAREVNHYQAELVKDRPDRFGHFAVLPLPDIDGAIAEAIYALDELNADGIVLLSNINGRYLGEEEFEPLWDEINSRSAVVFVHPTEPPIEMLPGLPGPVLDFPFDTTRTAVHMTINGVMSRYERMKVILSHAGGFLPYAAYRFAEVAPIFNPDTTRDRILADLKRFYFDTAMSSTPSALPSLLAFASPGHVLYGSDFPFAPEELGVEFDSWLDTYHDWRPGQLDSVNRGSAEALFSRM